MKNILTKTPYILLFVTIYRYTYIFMSIFIPELSIHPIKDFHNCSGIVVIVNIISIIIGFIVVVFYNHLERKINSSAGREFVRIITLSISLFVFSQTYRFYKITSFYFTTGSYESWSIIVTSTVVSIIVLSVYFYYNKVAKNTTKEWYLVIEKMKSETIAKNNIINNEFNSLRKIEEKLDSYSDILESEPAIPDDIKVYYSEIRQYYNSLMKKVPD